MLVDKHGHILKASSNNLFYVNKWAYYKLKLRRSVTPIQMIGIGIGGIIGE
jgi:hypothetical protein